MIMIDNNLSQLFNDLPDSLRKTMLEKGSVRDYPAGTSIVSPGDRGDRIRYLLSGRARVFFCESDGQKIPVETILPGDLIGEVSYLTGRPSPNSSEVIAQEPCRVLEIGAPDFETFVYGNPECALSVLRNLARKVIRLDQSVYTNIRKKRALQELISRQEHLFPDYFVSQTVRRRAGRHLEDLAQSTKPILVTGETGVGKEFMAHAIYEMSSHHKRVFLCLELVRPFAHVHAEEYCEIPQHPENLTEEQMKLFFGQETVANGQPTMESPGYLELTEGGTLLVRGIEQLTPEMQERLLVTLQTGKFQRIGSESEQTPDFRLIGATNLDATEVTEEKHPLLLLDAWKFPGRSSS